MAKKVTGMIKLQLPAGKATPAPPVGPALGQHGVNIMGFCKEFNAKTANQAGLIIPVVITVYQHISFPLLCLLCGFSGFYLPLFKNLELLSYSNTHTLSCSFDHAHSSFD